jgi:hypothetical protein
MWLVIERGVAVWGSGETRSEALGDANLWLRLDDLSTLDYHEIDDRDATPRRGQFIWLQVGDSGDARAIQEELDVNGGSLIGNEYLRSLLDC